MNIREKCNYKNTLQLNKKRIPRFSNRISLSIVVFSHLCIHSIEVISKFICGSLLTLLDISDIFVR